ncbi:MAG: lamin tail domain-containing protein [Tannerellaceae bacterium]|jgi:hypothetical protein|nr:lamin tail domain-containing protein [Tannerellaceae bacterium]
MKQILLLFSLLCPVSLFSQLNETFSGTEVTSDHPWEGDISLFSVHPSGYLQFISPEGEAGEASLYIPITYGDDMMWEIDVMLDFKTSNTNYLRIHVYSSDNTAYFIQAGSNTGQVSFRSLKGSTAYSHIKGRELFGDGASSFVRIRLTLEKNSVWTLYTLKAGETTFHTEGSYKSDIRSTGQGGYFSLLCRYIKGRVTYCYMDNITVVPYLTGPSLPEDPLPEDPLPEDPEPEDPEPSMVEQGEIIFNELLPNPYTGGSEYIELYNRSGRPLSLKGLAIATRKQDQSVSTAYPLSSILSPVEAGRYVLLTKGKAGVASFYDLRSPDVLYELKLPVLANTLSTLLLFRLHDGTVIDEISYASKWHASSIKDQKGVALERIDPDLPTQDAANWTSAAQSAGYGTPGYLNSQFRNVEEGESTGFDPPLLTENGDYLMPYHLDQAGYVCNAYLYNTSGNRVAEIANNELLGQSGQRQWNGNAFNGNRLQTGIYILFIELYHTNGKKKQYKTTFLMK